MIETPPEPPRRAAQAFADEAIGRRHIMQASAAQLAQDQKAFRESVRAAVDALSNQRRGVRELAAALGITPSRVYELARERSET